MTCYLRLCRNLAQAVVDILRVIEPASGKSLESEPADVHMSRNGFGDETSAAALGFITCWAKGDGRIGITAEKCLANGFMKIHGDLIWSSMRQRHKVFAFYIDLLQSEVGLHKLVSTGVHSKPINVKVRAFMSRDSHDVETRLQKCHNMHNRRTY